MKRLLKSLKTKPMTLVVSLPENTYEMAKAAWEAGADAIKVHINLFHNASLIKFGTIEEQRPVLEKILHDSPVPVGVVAGENTKVSEGVIEELVRMGFDFISLYGHHMPVSLCNRQDVSNLFAIDYSYSVEEVKTITNSFIAEILELSILPHEEYGSRLNARDLSRYLAFSQVSNIPTLLPTQRLIYPSDVQAIANCGVKAIMIGAIVFGHDLHQMVEQIKLFKQAINELKQ
ncbi:MAG: hypothetical protein AB7V00_01205 [Bacilli bacterium]